MKHYTQLTIRPYAQYFRRATDGLSLLEAKAKADEAFRWEGPRSAFPVRHASPANATAVRQADAFDEFGADGKSVFVVHGHSAGPKEAVARFLEQIGLQPIVLHEQADGGRTIIEKFEQHSNVGFAVVVASADDPPTREAAARGVQGRPRQNVILELGYFIGRLGRRRVRVLKVGEPEIPSDYAGVIFINFDDAGAWKGALARELGTVGYEFDRDKALGLNSGSTG